MFNNEGEQKGGRSVMFCGGGMNLPVQLIVLRVTSFHIFRVNLLFTRYYLFIFLNLKQLTG